MKEVRTGTKTEQEPGGGADSEVWSKQFYLWVAHHGLFGLLQLLPQLLQFELIFMRPLKIELFPWWLALMKLILALKLL